LPRAIIKSNQEKKWAWIWAGAPQNFGVPFNILATAETSDFKFGMQFGFSKAHHKITLWHGPGQGGALQNSGFPLIFLQ